MLTTRRTSARGVPYRRSRTCVRGFLEDLHSRALPWRAVGITPHQGCALAREVHGFNAALRPGLGPVPVVRVLVAGPARTVLRAFESVADLLVPLAAASPSASPLSDELPTTSPHNRRAIFAHP